MDMFVTPASASAPQYGLLRLAALTKLLKRHLWLIALVGLLGGTCAYLYARTLPKSFTASSSLTVEGDRFAIPELQGALRADNSPDPMPWVRTEVQALTTRHMITQVVNHLNLKQYSEFNSDLRPPSFMQKVKSFISSFLPSDASKTPQSAADPNEPVVSAASKALDVFQDNQSLVISVSFTAQNPDLAARFVNDLIETYVQSRAKRRIDANRGANTAITARIDQVRDDLAKIEDEMKVLRSKNELVGLRAGSVGQQQLEELTTAAARATIERTNFEVNYDRAVAAAKQGSSDALASVLTSPTVSRLRDQEALASSKVAELSTRYGPGYPGVRSANAELAAARRGLSQEADRIVSSLGAQLRVARQQEADVNKQLAEARATGVKSENVRAQLDQLQQEATTRRNLYQTLLERAQQTVVQPVGAETPDVRILSPAISPGLPSGPNMKLAGLMGTAGGALIGCLLSLTRLRSVDGFENAAELTKVTGYSVLASLKPNVIRRGKGILGRTISPGDDAEQMRSLRNRIRFAGRGVAPRSVAFLTATLSNKALTIAAAFARTVALQGERVLLIEADFSNARLASILGLNENRTGTLAAALSNDDWRNVVRGDRQSGLDVLLAYEADSNGPSMLQSAQFQNLLVEVRDEYDLVVINTPAATTADAMTVLQRSDLAVLVVDEKVVHQTVQDATNRLASAHRTPVVAVLISRT